MRTQKPDPAANLMKFAGTLDAQSAREMREVIGEGCGQIDWESWDFSPAEQERILKEWELSRQEQKLTAETAHDKPLPKGASIEDLMKVAGTLDDESAREMIEAIEEGCE